MGVSKTTIFTDEQNQIAALAKALGHPARIALLQELLRMDSCVCGDLVIQIGLAQSTVSQHLNELKKVGLIQGKIDGARRCYCINEKKWKEVEAQFAHFLAQKPCKKQKCNSNEIIRS